MINIIDNNMKKFFSKIINFLVIVTLWFSAPSCSNFLDVVPDNVFQYEDFFTSRQQGLNALASLYVMMPGDNWRGTLPLGDEYSFVTTYALSSRTAVPGASIMSGEQSSSNPLLNFWTGNLLPSPYNVGMWVVLRECDQFIRNVDRIPDMGLDMKAEWKAQAKFMKAYYLFTMVQMYGPMIIPEFFDEDGVIVADLFQPRRKVEDCFDYILKLIDEAMPYLVERRETLYLGQPDQVAAKAIKARILLVRASPFFNGNFEYYHNFRDHDGEHFFAQTEDREKWKAAADAAQQALDACGQYGFRLYTYKGVPYNFDVDFFQTYPDKMQTLYDLRFRTTERWNEEIIWGWIRDTSFPLTAAAIINKPNKPEYTSPSIVNQGGGWACASYQAMERYYTQHGLPLDEDRTVDINALHEIVTTPDSNSPDYPPLQGYMQPNVQTINMYLNREPRFYADLGITGGYVREHMVRFNTMMFNNADGGIFASQNAGYLPSTGIAIQKIVHPEAYHINVHTMKAYPVPIMRVSDVYLMLAEALNEYYGPTQEVWDAVNEVRLRAGIPKVEDSYGDTSPWVTDEVRNKHKDKEGMREIILRERANELAFEFAHRFWDMQRWKRSVTEFSRPLFAWNVRGTTAETFFVLRNIQGRRWGITECLWPIEKSEMERNTNLIQNQGW